MTAKQRVDQLVSEGKIITRLTMELYHKQPNQMTLEEWDQLLDRVTKICKVEKSREG